MKYLESDAGGRVLLVAGGVVLGLALSDGDGGVRQYSIPGEASCVAVASAGKFVFGAFSSKEICCWDAASGEVLGTHTLKKKAMCISHAQFEGKDVVIVADRAGEVWFIGAPLMKGSICVGGHTASVITDLLAMDKWVVTADRDEKIRVSRFPQSALIQSYCLGHTSVVSSVCGFEMRLATSPPTTTLFLASSSWDHQVCLWELETGRCCGSLRIGGEQVVGSSAAVGAKGEAKVEAEAEAGREAGGEAGVEGEGEGDGEENDEAERDYDEQRAGDYPFRCLAQPLPDGRVLVVVLRRGQSVVQGFLASPVSGALQPTFTFGPPFSWTAPDLPVDMALLPSAAGAPAALAVLLPSPHYVVVLSCETAGSHPTLASSTSSAHLLLSSAYGSILKSLVPGGVAFAQQATVTDSTGDGQQNTGHILAKHSLDRPFNKLTGVAATGPGGRTGTGGHRGRKRPLDSVGVDKQAVLQALENGV